MKLVNRLGVLPRVFKRRRRPARFCAARDRGGAWLLAQQRPNGGIPDYYKALMALHVCGHISAAHRLCDWILAHEMTPQGDFGRRPVESKGERYAYVNAWIVIGAHRLGRFDLSHRGMDFLMSFRDPESGGFYSSQTRRDAGTKQDLMVVGFCGLAGLYTGRLDVARGAGRWLAMLMAAQPSFPEKLYTVYSRADGLHTVPGADDPRRYVVVSRATSDQLFFQPGIAGAFLALLFQATQEAEWLDLAKHYMRFAENASDHLFALLRAGKIGWAAAQLAAVTGEGKYTSMAARVGDNLIAAQSRHGFWRGDGTAASVGLTAEMVVWLDAIHRAQ